MTKTEACRRVALAALLAATLAGAHEARADPGFKITVNGLDLNGFADRGAFPTGDGPDGAEIVVGARPPTPDPSPKRSSGPKRDANSKRGSDLGGVQVAAGGGGDKPGTGGTDPK